ncbi:MAG: 4-hydroxythreonine-4-phosphate dehydrogenase PdxA [Desulfofustis sp. PB-SRB1]|nr:4-hydroxythreonine-4-phosphate dehydrogenase PdxA [Desulfofustis sp. PB-SRB1]
MTHPKEKKPLGITMGCPVSIGPEIIVKWFTQAGEKAADNIVVLGDIGVLRATAAQLKTDIEIQPWLPGAEVVPSCLNVLPLSSLPLADKKTMHDAGFHYPGHTELLAQHTGADRIAMMMAGSRLRVVLVSIHCPLALAPELLKKADLESLIALTDLSLKRDFGITRPRIAVAGLNPHSGEEGLFGSEEQMVIQPAVAAARNTGVHITGPLPPDTVYYLASHDRFDAVISMYHDQGLIPFKLLHFHDGVNVTLGLPIVRTSVDHGTAYDIAGTGTANAESLSAAIAMAFLIVANRTTA